jgi:hypothetical protein
MSDDQIWKREIGGGHHRVRIYRHEGGGEEGASKQPCPVKTIHANPCSKHLRRTRWGMFEDRARAKVYSTYDLICVLFDRISRHWYYVIIHQMQRQIHVWESAYGFRNDMRVKTNHEPLEV